jgi:hypothetical protein
LTLVVCINQAGFTTIRDERTTEGRDTWRWNLHDAWSSRLPSQVHASAEQLRLITFDADGTLYADGAHMAQDNRMIQVR